jgi:KaiC/GvpD/RAD55 family RecA-like ATPase
LPVIDKAIGEGNLFAGDVIVLKGPSGSGKSAVALAFLLSSDLYRPGEGSDSALLVTNVEAEIAAKYRIEMVYERLRKEAPFARSAQDIGILGMPGGFVKPGYILQRVEDYFERARMRRDPVARVAVDNVVNMDFSAPFISDDVTFGDTLVDLMRKHRVTSLFVCRDGAGESMTAFQRSVLNSAECLIQFSMEGSTAYFEVKKSRGMCHKRGLVPIELDSGFPYSKFHDSSPAG